MRDDPLPFYPELACHLAPLPPGEAPLIGCVCRICVWARTRSLGESYLAGMTGPVQPDTPAWAVLISEALR